MNTNDFNRPLNSDSLNESLQKTFNVQINFDKYTREQLENYRNLIRTKVHQVESTANFNDLLSNEVYQKDKFVLNVLNTRIKEMLGESKKQVNELGKDTLLRYNYKAVGDPKRKKGRELASKKIDKIKQDQTPATWDPSIDDRDQYDESMVSEKMKSQQQSKLMHAAADDPAVAKKTGVSQKVAKEFVKKSHGQKVSKLPKKVKKTDEGSISEISKDTAMSFAKKRVAAGDTKGVSTALDKISGTAKVGATDPKPKKKYYVGTNSVMSDNQLVLNDPLDSWDDVEKFVRRKIGRSYRVWTVDQKGKIREIRNWSGSHWGYPMDPGPHDPLDASDLKPMYMGEGTKMKTTKKAKPDFLDMDKDGNKKEPMKKAVADKKKTAPMKKAADKKKTKVKESIHELRHRAYQSFIAEGLANYLAEDEEGKAKAITAGADMVNDFTSWMQRVGNYQTKSMIELADNIRANFGVQQAETFKASVGQALEGALNSLTAAREEINNAVAVLAGEAPAEEPMGQEPGMGEPAMGGDVRDLDAASPDAMNLPAMDDEFAASDAAAGGMDTTGRMKRESIERGNRLMKILGS